MPAAPGPRAADRTRLDPRDKFRILAYRRGPSVRLLTRNGHDTADRFPLAAAAIEALPVRSCVIDGEAIVCDDNGLAVFDLIRGQGTNARAVLCAFDLLEVNGEEVRPEPIEDRKRRLAGLLRKPREGIALNETFREDGAVINKHACALDCEGIVSKRFGSPWDYGRRTPAGCVMLRNQWTGGTLKMSEALIGQDDLPITGVGKWTLEKHERLVRYIDITSGVRRQFARTESSYIELFCGPGRSVIEEDGEVIDGSPVRAMRAAQESGAPYTDFHLADFDAASVDATCKRLRRGSERVHQYDGEAEHTVDEIAAKLNPYGLHFAFLDPYKLDPLPFAVLEKLARFKRMDMLIHVSIHDFQRNLRLYMEETSGPLDRFAPGWRSVVDERAADQKVRIAIFQHWLGLIKGLDMAASEGVEHVVGSKNQPLYWLVLVARHEKAHEFWDKIRNVRFQREFKF